jgi:hypothetical protein
MAATNSTVIALSSRQLRDSVDKLAALKAQIRNLKRQEEFLCDLLKDQGDGEYIGKEYIATVATSERQSLDTAIVKGFLTPAQIIAATKSSTVVTLNVKEL